MMRPCSDRGIFRFLAMAILIALAVTLAVALPRVSAAGGEDGKRDDYSHDQAPPIPEKAELNYPNLGSRLDQLVIRVEEGEATSQDAAGYTPVHSGESVAVTIYLSGNVDDVVSFLEENGGDPRNVGQDYIEAYVPVSLLGPTSEQPRVLRMREIIPPQPGYGNFTSQGVQAHAAAAWHQAGITGKGVKVGIIDVDFEGFRGLLGTELPATVAARCYTDVGVFTQNLADCETDSDHGTIVAESVIDIAPEVSLYIAIPRSKGDVQAIVDWMMSEGVFVINTSIGWTFDGPGDGTSPFSRSPLKAVDRAVGGGAIWVSSAHNHAQTTWFGTPLNADDDGFIDFSSPDETNDLLLEAGQTISVQLRWEGIWGQEDTDLDMILYDSNLNPVWYSGDYQSGPLAGDFPIPWDYMEYEVPRDGVYHLAIYHSSGPAPGWIQMVGWGTGTLQYHTESGSITNPSESANPGLLAVGAAPWYDLHTIEPYSSRGPTPDGRVKPDIVGATCGETALQPLNENRRGFCGTSQASPHVAGMAALVRQRFPDYTPAQVAAYLKNHAQQRETPDPNNTWGHGFAQLPSPDRETLVAFYNATSGANWTEHTNWLTNAPVGHWHGVTTDSQGRVTELNLTSNQLKGEIPPELANLTNLKVLALGGNELTGPIPTWLGGLTNLEELYLWENELTGTIPAELGSLANLEELYLSANRLTGEIPVELGSLSNLVQLVLWGNELTGEIPAELGSLSNLERLSLSANQLTGEIPPELGSLVNLKQLWLSENQLTGEIPAGLGSLSNLVQLVLWGNELTGEIPAELGSLSNLELLSLSANQLTGEIPAELGSLANLEELYLSANRLTGEIPVELGSPSNLVQLVLWGNELTGEIPAELGSLSNLERLSLSANQLTGEIPAELGSLTNLERLYLWGNQLTGEIPAELGSLANLEELYLSANRLTGEIPVELGSPSNLVQLVLWGNELTGEIPAELGSLSNLERLSLSANQLTGEIPAELGSLANLVELWLADNQLTGEIPVELGSPSNLVQLVLWGNELTGEIPAELGSLYKLELLSLSTNQLTGEMPPELGNLTNLERLYLWGNQLTGMIPQTLVGLTMLESFIFDNNPGLCAPIDDAFQTWLGSISTVLGSSCAPADSPEDRAVLVQVHSATDGANWTNNTNWLSEEHFIREWYGVTNDANGRVHGLFLGDNQLAGGIPPELGSLANLELLSLSANQLTGEIPAEMGSLANLRSLSLRDNQLSGEIPPELGSLANLEWLRLNNNQLTGEIPAELGRLTNLTVLHLSGNQLTGCVPASLQDVANNDFAQLGLPFCPSYDANGNGVIDIGELFSAIDDYFDGRIDISELFTIIDLYFSGATPTATAQPPGAPTGLTATANGPENREWPGVRPGNHAEHSAP